MIIRIQYSFHISIIIVMNSIKYSIHVRVFRFNPFSRASQSQYFIQIPANSLGENVHSALRYFKESLPNVFKIQLRKQEGIESAAHFHLESSKRTGK